MLAYSVCCLLLWLFAFVAADDGSDEADDGGDGDCDDGGDCSNDDESGGR